MKRIRYGIIGFGRFAEKTIAPAIQASPNSELVAIQKRSGEAAREKARELGIPHAVDTIEALVKNPEIDAVFIVSANSAHCPETLAAAREGKHVLVEKPMAMDVAECEKMIASCQSAGVKLMVGHMLRFSPLINRMRELISTNRLGALVHARADFVYDARLSHRSWLYDRRIAGGGPLFDIGVHCLDTLRYVLNDEVVQTHGQLSPLPTTRRTEATASLLLRFSRGTIGSIMCSFAPPIRRTFIEIIGEEGVMSASNFTVGDRVTPLSIQTGRNDDLSEEIEDVNVPNLYIKEITHFSDCILKNEVPFLSAENALANQVVLDTAMEQRN